MLLPLRLLQGDYCSSCAAAGAAAAPGSTALMMWLHCHCGKVAPTTCSALGRGGFRALARSLVRTNISYPHAGPGRPERRAAASPSTCFLPVPSSLLWAQKRRRGGPVHRSSAMSLPPLLLLRIPKWKQWRDPGKHRKACVRARVPASCVPARALGCVCLCFAYVCVRV